MIIIEKLLKSSMIITWFLKVCPCVSVIHIVAILLYAMVTGVLLQNLLLVLDAVALPFVVIVTGQAAVESGPFVGSGLQCVSGGWH